MEKDNIKVSGGLRTEAESLEASLYKKWFDANTGSWEQKKENLWRLRCSTLEYEIVSIVTLRI